MAPTVYTSDEIENPKTIAGAMVVDKRRVRRRLKLRSLDRIEKSDMRNVLNKTAIDLQRSEGQQKEGPLNNDHLSELTRSHMQSIKSYRQFISNRANNGDLLDIAMRTLNLMRRNKILQRQLSQLQQETKEFMAAVMQNPENTKLSPASRNSEKSTVVI